MNKVVLIGRLTKDPEVRNTQGGNPVASFTVAVDRRYKDANGNKLTDFINCVAWRQQAQLLGNYFHKGNRIALVGNIQSRSYDDQQGVKHYVTEVIVDEIDFIESATQNQQAPAPVPENVPTAPAPTGVELSESDLPFEIDEPELPFEV